MPEAKKRDLVALLARHGLPLIEDDVYAELYFGDKRPLPAKAFDQQGLVLHCSSFPNAWPPATAWAGPRRGRFTQAVARQKLTTTLGASAPVQLALADYLRRGGYDKHLRRLRQTLATRKARMIEAVGPPLSRPAPVPPSLKAAISSAVELPVGCGHPGAAPLGPAAGHQRSPGRFSASRNFSHCLRLNYGQEWNARTEQALATLGPLAHTLCGVVSVHWAPETPMALAPRSALALRC